MEQNFSVAINQLLNSSPENIMLQLYELNSKIQSATNEDIIAIYHTLKGVDNTLPAGKASGQIQQLIKSAISRMATFIVMAKEPKKVHGLYHGVVGYDTQIENAIRSTKD